MKNRILLLALVLNILMVSYVIWHENTITTRTVIQKEVHTVYKNVSPDDTSAYGDAIVASDEEANDKTLKEVCPNGVRLIDTHTDNNPLINCK